MPTKWTSAEQIVVLLRQIEIQTRLESARCPARKRDGKWRNR
jgi:hypothetical protein